MSDSVLIIGGGVAGLEAAITCSKAGARAIVVEHSAIVGGKLAAPFGDRSTSDDQIPIPGLDEISALVDKAETKTKAETEGIEILTLADIESIEGGPGNFTLSVRERARFVTDACTRCNNCPQVCPQVVANEFDVGLTFRKAIYTPLQQTLPGEFVVDIENCLNKPPNYLPCHRCVEVCDDNAIDFDMPLDRLHKRQVAAIIIAVGFEVTDDSHLREFGYGMHTDVVTSMELQRLLQSPGPTGGFVAKPSNEEYPARILLVLHENSPYAAYIMSNQIRRLVDQNIEAISLLILEQKGVGAELDTLEGIATEAGVTLCRGVWVGIRETDNKALRVGYVDLATGRAREQEYDMVVLSSDVRPPAGLTELATMLGASLAESGYIEVIAGGDGESDGEEDSIVTSPTATSCPGIYAAGCATGPMGVEKSLEQARAAAMAALRHCSSQLARVEKKPGQRRSDWQDLTESEQRLRIEQLLESLIKLGES